MKLKCLIKGFILFAISFPAILVFSMWAGYMIATVINFANFEFTPYHGSNPISINWGAILITVIFYFYILLYKINHE